jgi:uncharacterized membrane-anchored protein
MTRNALQQARAIHELIARRLQNAEMAFGASLERLSALDAKIAALCIARAQIVHLAEDASAFSSIESFRYGARVNIEKLKKDRVETLNECEALRVELGRLLRRKIAIDGVLASIVEEHRRIKARAHSQTAHRGSPPVR